MNRPQFLRYRGFWILNKSKAVAIQLLGCASGVGKSLLTAALCRALRRRGYAVAPFKAQNMSLQAAVTPSGHELARAQWLQALACGLEAEARMNPILVKPLDHLRSQVIVNGRPNAALSRLPWSERQSHLWPHIATAYDSLSADYEVVIIEGAGSPAEVNLADQDLANLALALYARPHAYLIADIDRGGAYAHALGTWLAMPEDVRSLVRGFVLNKFRGDASLLDPAHVWLREQTGLEVTGVIPHIGHRLPEEDSVRHQGTWMPGARNIAVIEYPGASNLDDLDPLRDESGVSVVGIDGPCNLKGFDAVVLPGSRNVARSRAFLAQHGLDQALVQALKGGTAIYGICGGMQLLGVSVEDPEGIENTVEDAPTVSEAGRFFGLGLLPLHTRLEREKLTREVKVMCAYGFNVHGYEIRHGRTQLLPEKNHPHAMSLRASSLFPNTKVVEHLADGLGWRSGQVTGVYLHGLFGDARYRRRFLEEMRGNSLGADAKPELKPGLQGNMGISEESGSDVPARFLGEVSADANSLAHRSSDLMVDLDRLADAVEASGWVQTMVLRHL